MLLVFLAASVFAQTRFTLPAQGTSEYTPVPTLGAEQVIGYYNNGCILGAKPFATSTNSWELVNTQRNHQYGHSSLVDFVEKLGAKSVGNRWGKLMVGDSSCAMGGKMHEGHNSHQNGLDVDIFYQFIPNGQTLTHQQRNDWTEAKQIAIEIAKYKRPYTDENTPVVSQMTDKLKPEYLQLLKEAALDGRVERIFVSPPIKAKMCEEFKGADAGPWLAKLRPEQGHRSHFHVRLKCPTGSPKCKAQDPVPNAADFGCGGEDFNQWLRPIKRPEPVVPPPPPPPPKVPPPECTEARNANPTYKLNETSLCLTSPDGSLRCRDYQRAENFTRPRPAAGTTPASR